MALIKLNSFISQMILGTKRKFFFFLKQPNFIKKVTLSIRHTQKDYKEQKLPRENKIGNGKKPRGGKHPISPTAAPNKTGRKNTGTKIKQQNTATRNRSSKNSAPQTIAQSPLPFVEQTRRNI
jgi:hypothetical protein